MRREAEARGPKQKSQDARADIAAEGEMASAARVLTMLRGVAGDAWRLEVWMNWTDSNTVMREEVTIKHRWEPWWKCASIWQWRWLLCGRWSYGIHLVGQHSTRRQCAGIGACTLPTVPALLSQTRQYPTPRGYTMGNLTELPGLQCLASWLPLCLDTPTSLGLDLPGCHSLSQLNTALTSPQDLIKIDLPQTPRQIMEVMLSRPSDPSTTNRTEPQESTPNVPARPLSRTVGRNRLGRCHRMIASHARSSGKQLDNQQAEVLALTELL